MALPAWPGGAVRVFRDALPSGLLDSIAEESTAVAAAAPNFWVPRELIEQVCASVVTAERWVPTRQAQEFTVQKGPVRLH